MLVGVGGCRCVSVGVGARQWESVGVGRSGWVPVGVGWRELVGGSRGIGGRLG